ncbi:MAG: hypothetical protein IKY10_04330 [Clostridia bacterium]|nr:hypothetical protein [Clostridia bacterium]
MDKKRAQKVDRHANKRLENPRERFQEALNGRLGDRRLVNRLLDGRKVKPCGRECREYGMMIAMNLNHGSFQNFNELMNDEEFILEVAKITPNPTECENYFYQYVNPYLQRKQDFRLKFLKQVYLNENVHKLKDINLIVEWCGFEEENQLILKDKNFKLQIKNRIDELDYQNMIDYHCSGEDEKELHDYKVQANEYKVLCDNIKKGLEEILSTFEGEKEVQTEPKDFFEFMCQQSYGQN